MCSESPDGFGVTCKDPILNSKTLAIWDVKDEVNAGTSARRGVQWGVLSPGVADGCPMEKHIEQTKRQALTFTVRVTLG